MPDDITKVRISFDYLPDEPDPDDLTGMSEDEHVVLVTRLGDLGAENIEMKRVVL